MLCMTRPLNLQAFLPSPMPNRPWLRGFLFPVWPRWGGGACAVTGARFAPYSALEDLHTMTQSEVETFVAGLPNVQRSENYGYTFFFVGEDHRLPFVSLLDQDYDYDHVSNLSREGVYRVNIGVSRATFDALVGTTD